jgi:hypothetical protein
LAGNVFMGNRRPNKLSWHNCFVIQFHSRRSRLRAAVTQKCPGSILGQNSKFPSVWPTPVMINYQNRSLKNLDHGVPRQFTRTAKSFCVGPKDFLRFHLNQVQDHSESNHAVEIRELRRRENVCCRTGKSETISCSRRAGRPGCELGGFLSSRVVSLFHKKVIGKGRTETETDRLL